MTWALVPVKDLSKSKQRLGSVLGPGEREGLMLAMVRDVLTAISAATSVQGILLVSRSPQIRVVAHHFGAELFEESGGADLSCAMTEASNYLLERHAAGSALIIPGDVPLVRSGDIENLLARDASVVLVPDLDDKGSNAIFTTPPSAITFHYGPGSFGRHVSAARAAGFEPAIVRDQRIGLDIDELRDLLRLPGEHPGSHTEAFLKDSDIVLRLNNMSSSQTLESVRSQTGTGA